MRNAVWIFALGMAFFSSAPAVAEWSHSASGISIPDQIGDMQKGKVGDMSGGKLTDVAVQYGSGPLAVTVYVYKSSYPNPALWFNRTIALMKRNVGGFSSDFQIRSITVAGSPKPNGLRESFEINTPNGHAGPFKSTSIALIQVNEWLLKLRITSQNLGKDEIDQKMNMLIDAIRFNRPVTNPLPLIAPDACAQQAPFYSGKPLDSAKVQELLAEGTAQGLIATGHARGLGGLAEESGKWCSFNLSTAPEELAVAYRERQGSDFVILFADSGRSITAQSMTFSESQAKAALFANTGGSTRLVWMFDGLPTPDEALKAGFSTIVGKSEGLVNIDIGPGDK
jgi:hypothetical protein